MHQWEWALHYFSWLTFSRRSSILPAHNKCLVNTLQVHFTYLKSKTCSTSTADNRRESLSKKAFPRSHLSSSFLALTKLQVRGQICNAELPATVWTILLWYTLTQSGLQMIKSTQLWCFYLLYLLVAFTYMCISEDIQYKSYVCSLCWMSKSWVFHFTSQRDSQTAF